MKKINMVFTSKIILANLNRNDTQNLMNIFEKNNFVVEQINSQNELFDTLSQKNYDLVVVNISDIDDAKQLVKKLKQDFPWVDLLVILNSQNGADALKIIRQGAFDCFLLNFDENELILKIEKALAYNHTRQELTTLRQQVAMDYGFDNIIGTSETMKKLKQTLRRIAPTDISVMLQGAKGTGKKLIARVIHLHSVRRHNKFTVIDCSTIPEELFLEVLFGKSNQREKMNEMESQSLLLAADGGTVFFNEVDQIPFSVQSRLLEFLRDYKIKVVGRDEPVKIDVRVISATSKNMNQLIEEEKFSKELFYQLSVLPIKISSLTERIEDVELLTDYFLRRMAFEKQNSSFTISGKAMERLLSHSWPGNIMELENTLKRAVTICDDNHIEEENIIFFNAKNQEEKEISEKNMVDKKGLLDLSQRKLILKALGKNDWNYTQTAQVLGIGRTTLWRKVKKYNLKKELVNNKSS